MAHFKALMPTILSFTVEGAEHTLQQHDIVELPEGNDYVKGLVAQGYLAQVEVEFPEAGAAGETGEPGEPGEAGGTDTEKPKTRKK